jgi:hypothetical protein
MKRSVGIILCIFSLLILASCNSETDIPKSTEIGNPQDIATSPSNALPTMEPYSFITSQPDAVSIHGFLLVMDPRVMLPDPNDAIFLVPLQSNEGISSIPPFKVGEVPQADVDERTGEYMFTDIQPGQYAIVILTMGGAQVPARFYDKGDLAIIKVSESDIGKTVEIDELSLP